MMLSELITLLEELKNHELGPDEDIPVAIAFQPSWPMQSGISEVKVVGENDGDIRYIENLLWNNKYPEDREEHESQLRTLKRDNKSKLYIAGHGATYAPGGVFE